MQYVLDANIFIEAKRRYYRFDLCPGFWESLVWQHGQGTVWSIDRVRDELEDGKDDLAAWVKAHVPAACFVDTKVPDVIKEYALVNGWVHAQPQFKPAAKADFASDTDAWLIAYAKATGSTLVTHEELNEFIKVRVPIPNVCKALGVNYIDTFDMLKELKTRFDWAKPA